MITGHEIRQRVESGEIGITDFTEKQLNPNSYNLKLGDMLKVYMPLGSKNAIPALDMKGQVATRNVIIPSDGLLLQPGILYLGSTAEVIDCTKSDLIPCISGRSSIGRFGVNIHATAGFGDIGFIGTFTLEIFVVQPVIIYPYIEICQIYFEESTGDPSVRYKGKYLGQLDPQPSKLYEDFIKEN